MKLVACKAINPLLICFIYKYFSQGFLTFCVHRNRELKKKKNNNNSWLNENAYKFACVRAHTCTYTHTLLWGKKLLAFIWFSQSSMTQKMLIISKLNVYTPLRKTYLCVNLNPMPFHSSVLLLHPSAWNTFPSDSINKSYPFFKVWHKWHVLCEAFPATSIFRWNEYSPWLVHNILSKILW